MNVQFSDAARPVVTKENVIVCGVKLGTVELCDRKNRYHAIIELEGLSSTTGMLQGFAETKELSIRNALDKGRSNAVLLLQKLDELEQKLEGGN